MHQTDYQTAIRLTTDNGVTDVQFREVGRKVQCLASVYDPESKRTRQKMVFSLNLYGDNAVPDVAALATGTDAERAVWVGEIADYIGSRATKASEERVRSAPLSLKFVVDRIVHDLDSQSRLLTDADIDAVKREAARLVAALAPPAAAKSSRNAAGRKGVDEAVKERARELRKTETVARTSEILAAEGHAVSKSWVQKWGGA